MIPTTAVPRLVHAGAGKGWGWQGVPRRDEFPWADWRTQLGVWRGAGEGFLCQSLGMEFGPQVLEFWGGSLGDSRLPSLALSPPHQWEAKPAGARGGCPSAVPHQSRG